MDISLWPSPSPDFTNEYQLVNICCMGAIRPRASPKWSAPPSSTADKLWLDHSRNQMWCFMTCSHGWNNQYTASACMYSYHESSRNEEIGGWSPGSLLHPFRPLLSSPRLVPPNDSVGTIHASYWQHGCMSQDAAATALWFFFAPWREDVSSAAILPLTLTQIIG